MIEEAVSGAGAAVNAVVFAELCVGQPALHRVEDELRAAGFEVFDVPSAAAPSADAPTLAIGRRAGYRVGVKLSLRSHP